MDPLLKKILNAVGVSGYEAEIAGIMRSELKQACGNAQCDAFGNVIARCGKGTKRIMLCAHMDEVGFLVKLINKEGFLNFIKIGGIDDRVLIGQRVAIRTAAGNVLGVIGAKPPHLLKEEEKKTVIKHTEMFIDIGAGSLRDAQKRVALADVAVFEPNAGVLGGRLCYGKAVDDRVGCYCLIKIMERL
ncbi:MAG: M42 family peptidase, partial [Candidatus Omnitrophica bacterium]|nr:M42 family peptidase [Candidatus Omnitrophota bacterium]